MRTFVIVPVRNQWPLTRQMLHSLDAHEIDDVLVMDHGSIDETASTIRSWQRQQRYAEHYPLGRKIHRQFFDPSEHSIYSMWNAGFDRARRLAGHTLPGQVNPFVYQRFYVLVTNNDIILPRGAITLLRHALEGADESIVASYPDYDAPWTPEARAHGLRETSGVYGDGGMFGACFMLAGHRVTWSPLITDPNYTWWWADNHLAECIAQEGGKQVRIEGLSVRHVNEGTAQHHEDEIYFKKLRDRGLWITREARGVRAVDRRCIIPG